MSIRTAARAVIVEDGRLLTTENERNGDRWYLTPGGGQYPGETLHETLRREVSEEVGIDISVGPLLAVQEFIPENHGHEGRQQTNFLFRCERIKGEVQSANTDDPHQVGCQWLRVTDLEREAFYPRKLASLLTAEENEKTPVYLGDTR
ncbi:MULTISPECIES: NUDIX domain-containing protein [unclassified Haladaptatus]|uniref:NUDIX domain-containing protein n=1 Tax=unclassified Haladaptatus TaxID=2622732 RepID=UPI0023E8E197|nr:MULTISPECIES: NUDIX domain-containing protein [unclassified Haladaptatus]